MNYNGDEIFNVFIAIIFTIILMYILIYIVVHVLHIEDSLQITTDIRNVISNWLQKIGELLTS